MHILITAGPTREPIDPIRFISNRSTGKMGFAVAQAAIEAGHNVILITGPVNLPTPMGVTRIDVTTALEMFDAVMTHLSESDAYISTAAVADWRPATPSDTKLKKAQMDSVIHLVPNPDILKTASLQKGHRIFIGFAAETGDPSAEAQRKLRDKRLDFIVANDVTYPGAGFASDTNCATIYARNQDPISIPLMSKLDLGRIIIALAHHKK